MDACPYGNLMRQEGSEKWIAIAILYIELKWIFVRFSLLAPHTKPHFWSNRTTQTLPPPPHFVTFSAFPRPSSDVFPLPIDCTDLPANTVTCVSASPTRVYMRPSSPRVSSSLPDRVCVHCRVVTYSRHFLLRYSHGTFFCNVLNALRRLRPLTCVCSCLSTPPRGYIFRTFPSSLLQHIPSHTSAHAFSVTIMTFLFLISENNAVPQVSRLVIPGNAGHPG